ncbi:hypothetical protein OsJ_07780 [Oryza sativa Japonica Group]|uniref:Uncharacterized protein n=1 Tax=Oryza sativa subsp. japonica TaxID=39947 RepID=B9F1F8_ORYSJ|nr:hypothetical protein OsJ_07780 [Oryza sativa Japonica Group]
MLWLASSPARPTAPRASIPSWRPRQLKEYGEKVLVEIYQSMLTHGVVPIPVPAGGQAVTAVGGHNYRLPKAA